MSSFLSEYIFDLTATTSSIAKPPHSFSSFPEPFCFCHRQVGGFGVRSCLCHTAMSLPLCLCTHLLSGCLRAGCLCLCRSAHSLIRIYISGNCSKSRTSRSCCSRESSCLCTRACSAPAAFCACGCLPLPVFKP